MKNLPRRKENKQQKKKVWNLAKENGWKLYKEKAVRRHVAVN